MICNMDIVRLKLSHKLPIVPYIARKKDWWKTCYNSWTIPSPPLPPSSLLFLLPFHCSSSSLFTAFPSPFSLIIFLILSPRCSSFSLLAAYPSYPFSLLLLPPHCLSFSLSSLFTASPPPPPTPSSSWLCTQFWWNLDSLCCCKAENITGKKFLCFCELSFCLLFFYLFTYHGNIFHFNYI